MTQEMNQKFIDLRRSVMEKEFSKMNTMQRQAVFQVNGPLLILAGAGSGKTTVLVNRIANIIRYGNAYNSTEIPQDADENDLRVMEAYINGTSELPEGFRDFLAVSPCKPWQILAITFTNKAAGELKDRLTAMLGDSGSEIWASTFHATCARMLRKDGERLGYSGHFTVYDTDDSRRLMKDCQRALNIDDKVLSHKSILAEISRAKDGMLSPAEYLKNAGNDFRLLKIGEAYKMYQQRLKEADSMDFDDLLANAVLLLGQNPDVLEYYQNRFHYVMVDEYQDTNKAQYAFIRLLAAKRKNLCVVGDDDQSIYKFRGATIENIMSFEKTYPNALVIRLEQNYRSTQNILNAANAVISNNASRKGKTLWTQNPLGDPIYEHNAFSEQDEAQYVANSILDGVRAGRKFSDYVILYRMNSQSNMIERMFVKTGISYRIIGGLRFYERKEIRDMIAYLSVINNPADEIRLRRIINQPKRSIGDKTIAQAQEIAGVLGESLFDVISRANEFEPLKRTAPKLMAFASMMNELIEASNDASVSLEQLYNMILEKTDYVRYVKAENDDSDSRIENINELSSNIVKYEEDNEETASLSGFLEEVSLMTDIDNYDGDTDAVVMMTMHSAKGLEFPVVFLPGFEEGIFPGMQAIYNPTEIEEERRLAYVAITRARERLYIVHADSRMIFGTTSRNKPSRFAGEIPEELLERSRSREWKKPEPGMKPPAPAHEARSVTTNAARQFGPAVGVNSKAQDSFRSGDIVLHPTFGKGMVLTATPMGNDTMLEISFEKVGTKKLMSNFARLKRAQ